MCPLARPALDRRALGLALTRVANFSASADFFSTELPPARARRVGLTGPPGAGKSTLAGLLGVARLDHGRIGILAIDPTSAVTGGAILGDRIRMDDLAGAENVFIRSFGSRTSTDGLTDNLPELLDTMDRFDFDEVIVETVGVGQVELAARVHVDTLVLVIPPEAGDIVQAMKAGIIEAADIFVINKADLPAAAKMRAEIKRIVGLTRRPTDGWTPPVITTTRSNAESIVELSRQVDRHGKWLQASGQLGSRNLLRRKYRLRRWLERTGEAIIEREPPAFFEAPVRTQASGLVQRLLATLER
jgi:LAO/AO transport system kinase